MSNSSVEKFAVMDASGEFVGEADRNVVHRFGLWHPTFICMVFDSERDKVICQVKSARKHADNPELEIDFSAGGHIRSDEDPANSFRELEEELGLPVEEYTMHFWGKRQSAGMVNPERIENEWQYIWLGVVRDRPMDQFPFNDEVGALIELDSFDTVSLLKKEVDCIEATIYNPGNGFQEVAITRDNFVPAYITGEQIFLRLFERICSYRKGNVDLTW